MKGEGLVKRTKVNSSHQATALWALTWNSYMPLQARSLSHFLCSKSLWKTILISHLHGQRPQNNVQEMVIQEWTSCSIGGQLGSPYGVQCTRLDRPRPKTHTSTFKKRTFLEKQGNNMADASASLLVSPSRASDHTRDAVSSKALTLGPGVSIVNWRTEVHLLLKLDQHCTWPLELVSPSKPRGWKNLDWGKAGDSSLQWKPEEKP